jgi:hypothetical protein
MLHKLLIPNGYFVFISRTDGWDMCNNLVALQLTKDFRYEIFSGTKGAITVFEGEGTNLQYNATSFLWLTYQV